MVVAGSNGNLEKISDYVLRSVDGFLLRKDKVILFISYDKGTETSFDINIAGYINNEDPNDSGTIKYYLTEADTNSNQIKYERTITDAVSGTWNFIMEVDIVYAFSKIDVEIVINGDNSAIGTIDISLLQNTYK